MKTAVVTLSISSPQNDEWIAAGLPSKREYARRIGADFVNITERRLGGSVASEKYQIGGMLGEYDRVAYLDADLVIDPSAPNIFDLVPPDHFGIFDESTYLAADGTRQERTALMSWLRDGWPGCLCPFYSNNGVFVCSREHQRLFDWRTLNKKLNTYEQTHMCYRIWEALQASPPRIKVHWLSQSWNWMPRTWVGNDVSPEKGWVPEPKPDPCYVFHYPCHNPAERMAAMESLNAKYGLWTKEHENQ